MTGRQKRTRVWGQYALIATGLSALAYCAFAFTEALRYQALAREQMRKARVVLPEPLTTQNSAAMSPPTPLPLGGGMALVGRIDVPRIHISTMVAEGTSPRILRVAVGHIPGTASPGQAGNVGLAAHRDVFFRHLGELKSGDLIRLTVPGGEYVYSVRFTDVVSPNETWVLEPSVNQELTLVTCYPFYYVGPAPKRFIVRARRVDNE